MISSRQLTLQKAVKNLMKTTHFTNRWVKLSSIEKAIKTRYQLTGIVVSKATISRHLGKLEPDIDNMQFPHYSGVYRNRHLDDTYLYFQVPPTSPPYIPPPFTKPEWNHINEIEF